MQQLPPIAETRSKTFHLHGDVRADEYHWLRDRNDPAALAYLEAENRYAEEMMRDTERLREDLILEEDGVGTVIKGTTICLGEITDEMEEQIRIHGSLKNYEEQFRAYVEAS